MSEIRDFRLALIANVPQKIGIAGDFFAVLEATNDLFISVDDQPYSFRPAGVSQTGEFQYLMVLSLVNQNVIITAGYGFVSDRRQQIVLTVNATVESGNQNVPLVDVSIAPGATTQLAGVNADRKALVIKSSSLNNPADLLRVGSIAADATHGVEVSPGEGLTLDTEAAVYAYNAGANAVVVTLLAINRV